MASPTTTGTTATTAAAATTAVAATTAATATSSATTTKKPTIRTITAFVNLESDDFLVTWGSLFSKDVNSKISTCARVLEAVALELQDAGYIVQTRRIATNPFGEWIMDKQSTTTTTTTDDNHHQISTHARRFHHQGKRSNKRSKHEKLSRLERIDKLLELHSIEFCSLGPAQNQHEAKLCPGIVAQSKRFSCSMIVDAGDVDSANVAADIVLTISQLEEKMKEKNPTLPTPDHIKGGIGNFRFCSASSCRPFIPFFPGAKSGPMPTNGNNNAPGTTTKTTNQQQQHQQHSNNDNIINQQGQQQPEEQQQQSQQDDIRFAIGLENGEVIQDLLQICDSVAHIGHRLETGLVHALKPIQDICEKVSKEQNVTYLGIDTSFNPSLSDNGSIASAIECLREVTVFGGPGTLAAAAEITKCLQSLNGIQRTGYCGLMLPVCEDSRLAELGKNYGNDIMNNNNNDDNNKDEKKDDDDDKDAKSKEAEKQGEDQQKQQELLSSSSKMQRQLRITDLLNISSVCGVGVDTVPVPGDCTREQLASLMLDVAGLAGRWNKSLSCRVFPVPGKKAGDMTEFDSPYLVNTKVFSLE